MGIIEGQKRVPTFRLASHAISEVRAHQPDMARTHIQITTMPTPATSHSDPNSAGIATRRLTTTDHSAPAILSMTG